MSLPHLRVWALAVFVTATTVIGCTGPTEPPPATPLLTRLHVVLSIMDSVPGATNPPGTALFTVQAFLDKGRDANGRVREVVRDSLRVLGWTLAATQNVSRTDSWTELVYNGAFAYPRAAIGTEPLTIIAPEVAGVTADFPVLSWPTVRRIGPRDLTLGPADDLVLDLELPSAPAVPAFGTVQWNLAVVTVVAPLQALQLSGTELPPPRFRLDRALLPKDAAGRLHARFSLFTGREDNVLATGPYVVTPVVQTSLTWNINLP